jgi:hypothetical protein
MWPTNVIREYVVSRPPAELVTAWRSQLGRPWYVGRRITGQVSDEGFDLVVYGQRSFSVRCRGQLTGTQDGTRIRVEFSTGISFRFVVLAVLVCATAAFAILWIWEPKLVGPWAILCGIGAAVALVMVIFILWVMLQGSCILFERRLVHDITSA